MLDDKTTAQARVQVSIEILLIYLTIIKEALKVKISQKYLKTLHMDKIINGFLFTFFQMFNFLDADRGSA